MVADSCQVVVAGSCQVVVAGKCQVVVAGRCQVVVAGRLSKALWVPVDIYLLVLPKRNISFSAIIIML